VCVSSEGPIDGAAAGALVVYVLYVSSVLCACVYMCVCESKRES
jgi:hypothetical protein